MKLSVLGAGVASSHFLLDSQGHNVFPPGFFVEWGDGEHLMFECAEGVRFRLEAMGIDISRIAHVAVSHPHPDHYAPIHFIQSVYCKGIWGGEQFKRDTLSLYGPSQLIRDFFPLWKIHLPEMTGQYEWPEIALTDMMAVPEVTIGSATLRAYPVYHAFGRCEAMAYRLETPEGTIAYSGDTGDCEGVRLVAEGADVFVCESSGRIGDTASSDEYGHLDPATVGAIATQANVKTLILFHYTGLDADADIRSAVLEAGFLGTLILGKDLTTHSW
jgi:ribonuclease BN (tRNA processing enzyme)